MIFPQVHLDRVNRAATTLDGAAGKSINVAKVLHELGAHPVATGFLGGLRGEQLRSLLAARGIELDFVTVRAPTRECVTVIDQSAGTITELVEESQPVDAAEYDALLAIVRRRVAQCRAVIMSGTIASGGPSDLYLLCSRLAHEAGALAVADASRTALLDLLESRPVLVKPNLAELEATMGRQLRNPEAIKDAMRELHGRGAQRVVITAGADPTLAFDGEAFWRVTPPQIKAVNPIGSGDAFTAALVWRLTLGDDLPAACRWGTAAGAANALTPMAGEVNRAQVDALLAEVHIERI